MGSGSELGAAVGKLFGSLVGEGLAAPSQREADRLRRDAFQRINMLNIPPLEKQKLQQQYVEAVEAGKSNFENIKVDPNLNAAQQKSLGKMQDIANSQGLDAQARAALNQAQAQNERQRLMNEGAVRQNMQARGIRGSGLELLGLQRSQQGANEANSQAGFNAAALAAQRQYQANSDSAGLAGQMSDRSFGQQAQVANAQDQNARFNAQTRNQVNMYNNDIANAQDRYNKELLLRQYQLQRQKALDMYGAENDRAEQFVNRANRTRALASQGGEAVGRAIGMYGDIQGGGMGGGGMDFAGMFGGGMK